MTTEITLRELINLPLEVAALRREIFALKRQIAAPPPAPPPATTRPALEGGGVHYISIDYFIHDMLGFKSRSTYYNHRKDKSWPQRVYPTTGKPMLIYEECLAYQRLQMENRTPPERHQKPAVGLNRRGRPRKS